MSDAQRQILKVFPYVIISALYAIVSVWVMVHVTALDYAAYLIGAHGFVTGQDVYHWRVEDYEAAARILNIPYYAIPYRYSPVTALLISPLLILPYRLGLIVWSFINAVTIIGSGELLSRLTENAVKRWIIRLSSWLFVPFLVSLYAGQVNPLTVLLGALAVLAIRKGANHAAGAWAALAFLVKPTAVGLVCYPIWKGKWKTAAMFVLLSAFVLSLMSAMFGSGSFYSGVPFAIAGIQVGAYPPLQNLWGMAQRWFTVHEYGWSLIADPLLADKAGWVSSLGLAVATLLFCLPPLRKDSWRDAEWGMIIIAIALAIPATWYHHYAILAIPLAFLISNSETAADSVLAFAAWLLINVFGIGWHSFIGRTLLLDLGVIGALILWVGLARVSWRQRRASALIM